MPNFSIKFMLGMEILFFCNKSKLSAIRSICLFGFIISVAFLSNDRKIELIPVSNISISFL